MRGNIVDQKHGLGAMHLSIHGLVHSLGMRGVALAFEYAFVIELLRFVPKYQNDFVLGIQAGIIVVVVFRSGDAVSGEDHIACYVAGGTEIQWHEILLALEALLIAPVR